VSRAEPAPSGAAAEEECRGAALGESNDATRRLLAETGNKHPTRDALLRGAGQLLLKTSDTPLNDDEELADEFASLPMTLFERSDRARRQAEFFAARAPSRRNPYFIKRLHV